MRRTLTTALLAGCLLVLLPGVALAHASFDVQQLPAGSTQDLVLRVPLEREAANDLVEVLVPGAFTVTACPGAAGWSCEQATTADGDTVVTLTRGPDGVGDAEQFDLSVTAPEVDGVYAFPTIQTYGDGVEAAWIGEPGTDQPAPGIQVGDQTAPVEFSGDATPHTELATDEATSAPSPAVSDVPSPAPSATAEPTPDAGPTATAAGEGVGERDRDRDQPGPGEDEGPPGVLLAVGAFLTVVAIAGAIARYRSVTS